MSKDLRRYAHQTNVRLFAGFILLLFLVGDGLIFVFLGREAAVLGFLCILAGLAPLLLIWLVFIGLDAIVKRNQDI